MGSRRVGLCGRLASTIGGRWDWWEVDSQNWWEVGGWPAKRGDTEF